MSVLVLLSHLTPQILNHVIEFLPFKRSQKMQRKKGNMQRPTKPSCGAPNIIHIPHIQGRCTVLKPVYKSVYGTAVYGEFWRQRYYVSPYTPIPTIYTKEIGVKKVPHFFLYFFGFALFFGPAISHLTLRQQWRRQLHGEPTVYEICLRAKTKIYTDFYTDLYTDCKTGKWALVPGFYANSSMRISSAA